MAQAKQILFDETARAKLRAGVVKLARAVKGTLGPAGKNVLLQKSFGGPVATRDGVTVSKEIELEDPFENMGAKLVNEVATKTSDAVGDGTTTATVLAEAIFYEGLKYLQTGVNPVKLRAGIERAVDAAVEHLKTLSRPVKRKEEIAQVGTISANHDATIGQMLADAVDRVGKDGVITVEEAKGVETSLEFVEGLQFDKGFISPYFITDIQEMACVFEDAFLLLFEKKISNVREFLPILERVSASRRPLLVVAEDVEGEALATLVVNRLKGTLQVCAVKAPAFGERRKAILQDVAILAKGTAVTEDLGLKLENLELSHLGRAQKVRVEKDTTTIVGGAGSKKDIDARVAQIRAQIEKSTSEYDKEKLGERLAKLTGGVAVIRVGAETEAAMKEKKARVDDALHATRAAVEEGIVPGGGVALFRCSEAVENLRAKGDEQFGIEIVSRALSAPLRQLVENAGEDGSVVAEELRERKRDEGFDVMSRRIVDLVEAGIVDPTKVVRVALQNAASIAALLLTTDSLVTQIKEKKKKVEGAVA
jgi:chaperonin GroEL